MPTIERKKIVVTLRKEKQPASSSLSSMRQAVVAAAAAAAVAPTSTSTSATSDLGDATATAAAETQHFFESLSEERRASANTSDDAESSRGSAGKRNRGTYSDETTRIQDGSQGQGQQRRRRSTHGLPSFASPSKGPPRQHQRMSDSDADEEEEEEEEFCRNDFDPFHEDDGEEDIFMPCETMMVLTSLLQDPARRVTIPILGSGGNSVYGVSPCHLYAALDGRDPVVLNELRQLLQQNAVCKLRLEGHVGTASATATATAQGATVGVGSDPNHHLLLLKSEYCRAARQSALHELDPNPPSRDVDGNTDAGRQLRQIVEWFLEESNVVDTISEQEVELCLRKRGTRSLPNASLVLSRLQSLQLLRPLPASHPNHSRTIFQLWLPSWGLVVRAWEKTTTQLLAHLKRSHYRERSYQSLLGRNGPIPADLVLEHLVSQGRVVKVERPSGTFVKLAA